MSNHPFSHSRRDILKAAAVAAGAAATGALPLAAAVPASEPAELLGPTTAPATRQADPWRGLRAGVVSYSFRKQPLDYVIKALRRLDLRYTSIKDFHLPLASTTGQRKEVAAKLHDAGIIPLSCGVITMQNDEGDCRHAFEYARDLGVPVIVCNPDPQSMPILGRLVKEFDLRLAIHNHGPESDRFKSPYDVWKVVEPHDQRIGLCIDVGHTARAGVDPAEAVVKCRSRLYDVHFKDISHRDRPAAAAEVEVGRGILDVRGMLAALLEVGFAGHLGLEHEKNPEDPLPGAAESIGYTKAALSCVGR